MERKYQIGDRLRSYDGFSGRVVSTESIEPSASDSPHHRVRVVIDDNHSLFSGGQLIEMEGAEHNFQKI